MITDLRYCIVSKYAATIVASESAATILYHTPFTPKKEGKISNPGNKKTTCLDNDMNMAFPGRPMLWKKFEVTI